MKREDLLKASKEILESIQLPFKIRKDKKTLEAWIIDREQKIAELENKVQEEKSAKDFDVEKLLTAIDNLQLERRRLDQGNTLLTELF